LGEIYWIGIGGLLVAGLVFLVPQSFAASVDEEARAEAIKFFETKYTKCGDSYYTFRPSAPGLVAAIEQNKGLTVTVKPIPVTEADKLNGVVWKGLVTLQSPFRLYIMPKKEWLEWKDSVAVTVFAENKLNKWSLRNVEPSYAPGAPPGTSNETWNMN
jgi:hypothetical protein